MVTPSSSSAGPRGTAVILATLLGTAILVALRFGEFPVGAGTDDAYYIELARSMAEGRGPVIHLNDVAGSWRPDIFPLGFPLLLTPLALLAPESLAILKAVPVASLLALVPLSLLLAARWNPGRGPLLAALVCLNPWTIAFATRVFADVPFTAFSLAAILLFLDQTQGLDQTKAARPTIRGAMALVLVTAGAIMIRTVGFALPAAMVVSLLAARRWKAAAALAAAVAVALIPHAILSGRSTGGLITGAYLEQVFQTGAGQDSRPVLMFHNLIGYLKELPVVMVPLFGKPLELMAARSGLGWVYEPLKLGIGLLLTVGAVGGWLGAGRSAGRRWPEAIFVVSYLAIYAGALLNFSGYPSGVQARLLLPVLPLLYLGLLMRLDRFGGRWAATPGVVVMLILIAAVFHNAFRVARPLTGPVAVDGQGIIDPRPGAAWVRSHTGPRDLIMTRWPLLQHIHFLRPVTDYGPLEPETLKERLAVYQVDYLWAGSAADSAGAALRAITSADEKPFSEQAVSQDGAVIFRIRRDP